MKQKKHTHTLVKKEHVHHKPIVIKEERIIKQEIHKPVIHKEIVHKPAEIKEVHKTYYKEEEEERKPIYKGDYHKSYYKVEEEEHKPIYKEEVEHEHFHHHYKHPSAGKEDHHGPITDQHEPADYGYHYNGQHH